MLYILQKRIELNKKLQRKKGFVDDLSLEVKSFQIKLLLFVKQMSNKNLVHFPLLNS